MNETTKTDVSELAPEEDFRRVANHGEALLALETIARHLHGEMRGDLAAVANELGEAMARREQIREKKLDMVASALVRVEANLELVIEQLRPLRTRLAAIENEHSKNHPQEEALIKVMGGK